MNSNVFDLVIIGGGINGAGIAADAAGRGLSVYLCEQNDFASATSSASSKLIHGGLRYLEHYEFRLVNEALKEREVLLANAPHLVKPMRFILPHRPHLRPAWMIRIGLFMYDQLGKRETLAGSHNVNFDQNSPLKANIKQGFEYSDCAVDDARLVISNLISAKDNGATLNNQTRCIEAKQMDGLWHLTMQDMISGREFKVTAKTLVNAAGPWVANFIKQQTQTASPYGIRLIKGSHIVVPRLHNMDKAFILQNEDNRVVFVIPYLNKFSLIGTTDVEYQGDPRDVKISLEESNYLLNVANDHFKHQLTTDDIKWSFSGVRPLCDDESDNPAAITRDYTLALDSSQPAPLLSIFGGKITTYRKLAEAAMKKLQPFHDNMGASWTRDTPLPGGNFPEDITHFNAQLQTRYSWMNIDTLQRYSNAYGTRCDDFLNGTQSISDMGQHFGHGLYAIEVDYLLKEEWVVNIDDLLWRRSKLGLFINPKQKEDLTYYINEKHHLKMNKAS
jgi:glycerol-3-phosphate dehydrogenase